MSGEIGQSRSGRIIEPRTAATDDDEFAPLDVKVAEPAHESIQGKRPTRRPTSDGKPMRESAMPTEPVAALAADDDAPAVEPRRSDPSDTSTEGGSRAGLWVAAIAIVALLGAGIIFKDAIFGGDEPDKPGEGETAGKQGAADSGKAEPMADTRAPADSTTGKIADSGKTTDDADTTDADTTDATTAGVAGTTDTPEPSGELTPEQLEEIEDKLKAARRNLKTFQRSDNAMKLIDEILEIAPNHAPTLLMRAEVLVNEGKLDQALAAARRAKLADPELPEIFSTLGALLESAGDMPGALEAYQRYLELDPKGSQAAAVKSSVARLQRELGG